MWMFERLRARLAQVREAEQQPQTHVPTRHLLAPAPTVGVGPAPARARVVEQIQPDGRLVSGRGPVRVYGLNGSGLPADSIVYITRGYGHFRFRFTIVRSPNGECRAYIREQPAYAGRPADANTTHRLHDHHGHYVCWSPMPHDARAIVKIAGFWAERTARYIATGRRIEAP